MMNFNKDHVTAKMAENNPGMSKVKAGEYVDEVLVAIIETLSEGKDSKPDKKGNRARLTMVGFGTLVLRAIPKRKHRNPQTGDSVEKDAHNALKFLEGTTFSDSIN